MNLLIHSYEDSERDPSKDSRSANLLYRGLQEYSYETDQKESDTNESDSAIMPADEHLSDLSNRFSLLPNQSYLAISNDSSSQVLSIDLRKFLLLSDELQAPDQDTDEDEYADIDIDKEEQLTGFTSVQSPNVSFEHLTSINNLSKDFSPLPIPNDEPYYDDNSPQNKREETDFKPFIIRAYSSEDDTGEVDEAEDDNNEPMTLSNAKTVELQNGETKTGSRPLDQEDSASQKLVSHTSSSSSNGQEAYLYTTIENRPIASYQLPHPPLQHEYPKSIQNNYVPSARVVNRPSPPASFNPPIPQSLPSIVHEPNAVLALQNTQPVKSQPSIPLPVPLNAATTQSQSQSYQYAPYYAAPIISSTNSNHQHPSQYQQPEQHQSILKNQIKEKVVVKIVPAAGWYLNDENERRSYFNAVAQGLLTEDGYVFVNDVQRVGSQPNQNVFSLPSVYQSSQTSQSTSQAQQQAQYQFYQRYGTPTNGAVALTEPRQVSTRQISASRNFDNTNIPPYRGHTSYGVPLNSVGKLAGDNVPYNYNLASLRSNGRR